MEMPGQRNEARKRFKQTSKEERCICGASAEVRKRENAGQLERPGGQDGWSTMTRRRETSKAFSDEAQDPVTRDLATVRAEPGMIRLTSHDFWWKAGFRGQWWSRVKNQEAPAIGQVKDVGDVDTGARVGAETGNWLLDTFQKVD